MKGSMPMRELFLEPRDLATIREILRKHVPGRAVWAFGSRATGRRLKPFSDLDLAIEGRLSPAESIGLREDFDECTIPMKVDVTELDLTTPEFRDRVAKDFVLIQMDAIVLV